MLLLLTTLFSRKKGQYLYILLTRIIHINFYSLFNFFIPIIFPLTISFLHMTPFNLPSHFNSKALTWVVLVLCTVWMLVLNLVSLKNFFIFSLYNLNLEVTNNRVHNFCPVSFRSEKKKASHALHVSVRVNYVKMH